MGASGLLEERRLARLMLRVGLLFNARVSSLSGSFALITGMAVLSLWAGVSGPIGEDEEASSSSSDSMSDGGR